MTLYALEADVELGEELDRPPVVPPLEHGGDYLSDAVALWRLVDERRADALQEFLNRAEEDESPDGHPFGTPHKSGNW